MKRRKFFRAIATAPAAAAAAVIPLAAAKKKEPTTVEKIKSAKRSRIRLDPRSKPVSFGQLVFPVSGSNPIPVNGRSVYYVTADPQLGEAPAGYALSDLYPGSFGYISSKEIEASNPGDSLPYTGARAYSPGDDFS